MAATKFIYFLTVYLFIGAVAKAPATAASTSTATSIIGAPATIAITITASNNSIAKASTAAPMSTPTAHTATSKLAEAVSTAASTSTASASIAAATSTASASTEGSSATDVTDTYNTTDPSFASFNETTSSEVVNPTELSQQTTEKPDPSTLSGDVVVVASMYIDILDEKLNESKCVGKRTCLKPIVDEKHKEKSYVCQKMKDFASCIEEKCADCTSLVAQAHKAEKYSKCDGADFLQFSVLLMMLTVATSFFFSN